MELDQGAAQEITRKSSKGARLPGSAKSELTKAGSTEAIERSRVRERRVEIDTTTSLEAWKMFDGDTVFHFRLETVTICGFGPTDKPEYETGWGGTVVDTDHVCRLCQTGAHQQGVKLIHPANGQLI